MSAFIYDGQRGGREALPHVTGQKNVGVFSRDLLAIRRLSAR